MPKPRFVRAVAALAKSDRLFAVCATAVLASVADVLLALILKLKPCRTERDCKPIDHFFGDGSGGSFGHRAYIVLFKRR